MKIQDLNVECSYCGKKFHKKPSHIHKYNYCNMECMANHRKILYTGENNPQYGIKGRKNSSWKSDSKITNYGYRKIRSLDHPFKDSDDFVFEHRLIAEKYLLTDDNSVIVNGKKYLDPELEVHHINKDRLDNSVENLIILTKTDHAKLHSVQRRIKGKYMTCPICGKEFYTSDDKRRCCSRECSNKYKNIGTSITTCPNCLKEFKVKNSRLNNKEYVFCSRKCYYEYNKK